MMESWLSNRVSDGELSRGNRAELPRKTQKVKKRKFNDSGGAAISKGIRKPAPCSDFKMFIESEKTKDLTGDQQQETDESVIYEILKQATTTGKISYRHRSQFPKEYAAKIAKALQKLPPDSKLSKLKLRNCGISNEFLKDFLAALGKKIIRIRALNLRGNQQLDMGVVEEVRSKLQSEVVDLSGVELNQEQMKTLGNMQKLKVLKLERSSFAESGIANTLAKLINDGLEELILVDSEILDQDLEEIAKLMEPKIALKNLDLSHVDLSSKGVGAVVSILSKTDGMEKLRLSNCGLTGQLLQEMEMILLKKYPACVTVAALDINSNEHIVDENGVEAAAALTCALGCEELDISSNDLTDENIEQLMSVNQTLKVQTLFIGENRFQDWSKVAKLVKQWGIKNLDITESRMNTKDTKAFMDSLEDYKLKYVDMRHPDAIITEEKEEALKALKQKTEEMVF